MNTQAIGSTHDFENCGMSLVMQRHFAAIARRYRKLRTTDTEPVSVICDKLMSLAHIDAVDVGCGDGRYDLILYQRLGGRLKLTCLDASAEMLATLKKYLARHRITSFEVKHSVAEALPFPDSALDCVLSFNAIHHFNLPRFLHESARVLKVGGYLFIYTRLREQNEKNIWGRYFPQFQEKETRLYSLDEMRRSIGDAPSLKFEAIVFFAYSRLAALEHLLERARSHHYSTFSLYSPEELERALEGFASKIKSEFPDPQQVQWFDENVLFIVRRQG